MPGAPAAKSKQPGGAARKPPPKAPSKTAPREPKLAPVTAAFKPPRKAGAVGSNGASTSAAANQAGAPAPKPAPFVIPKRVVALEPPPPGAVRKRSASPQPGAAPKRARNDDDYRRRRRERDSASPSANWSAPLCLDNVPAALDSQALREGLEGLGFTHLEVRARPCGTDLICMGARLHK